MNQMTSFAWPGWLALIAVATLGVSIGCRQEAPITQYTIDERVPEDLQDQQRLVGAIVPKGDAVWFFKVMGPSDAVELVVEPVRDVVQSVRFDRRGEPVLEAPSHWKRLPAGGMTFAKFDIPTEENLLQMTVTRLSNQGDWDELVVANVNRWRGQVGLEPSEKPWAGGEPLAVDAASSEGAVWVDLIGETDSGGSGPPPRMSGTSPPFAAGGPAANTPPPTSAPPDSPSPSAPPAAESTASDLEYELPEGWRPGRSGGMRIAAFEVGEEVEITLIRAGGDMRGNMKMWAGQVKLTENADAAVETSLQEGEELTVGGQAAKRFFIEGPGDPGRAIDVAVVESDNPDEPQLFVKMSGPAAKVREQSDAFGKFLDSLEI